MYLMLRSVFKLVDRFVSIVVRCGVAMLYGSNGCSFALSISERRCWFFLINSISKLTRSKCKLFNVMSHLAWYLFHLCHEPILQILVNIDHIHIIWHRIPHIFPDEHFRQMFRTATNSCFFNAVVVSIC